MTTSVDVRERPTPWDARGDELEARDGPYSHYSAWEEWMRANLDDGLVDAGYDAVTETLDGVQLAWLYSLMARLASGRLDAIGGAR